MFCNAAACGGEVSLWVNRVILSAGRNVRFSPIATKPLRRTK